MITHAILSPIHGIRHTKMPTLAEPSNSPAKRQKEREKFVSASEIAHQNADQPDGHGHPITGAWNGADPLQ
jgi:hypothetical protein